MLTEHIASSKLVSPIHLSQTLEQLNILFLKLIELG